MSDQIPSIPCARPGFAPSAVLLQTHLANADQDRLDALEEAECAAEDRDGYRRELARIRAQLRETEAELRAERHEHAETMAALAKAKRVMRCTEACGNCGEPQCAHADDGSGMVFVDGFGLIPCSPDAPRAPVSDPSQTAPFARTRDSEAGTAKDEGEGTNVRPGANAGG